jgi:hypothetical protein
MAPSNAGFSCFSRLPRELQLEVWRFACQLPRVVEIRIEDYSENITPVQGPPSVLQVSRNSREVALQHYKLIFGQPTNWNSQAEDLSRDDTSTSKVYFNSSVDILRIGDSTPPVNDFQPTVWSTIWFLPQNDRWKIERLAVPQSVDYSKCTSENWVYVRPNPLLCMDGIHKLPNLKEILVITDIVSEDGWMHLRENKIHKRPYKLVSYDKLSAFTRGSISDIEYEHAIWNVEDARPRIRHEFLLLDGVDQDDPTWFSPAVTAVWEEPLDAQDR